MIRDVRYTEEVKVSELTDVKNLHHAYLVAGHAELGAVEVLSVLEKRGIETRGNPDFYRAHFSELGVDESRKVAEFASLKPIGEKKYVLISWSRATAEAQNALLKNLEDARSTAFFISVDSSGHALPTIRSRCVLLSAEASMPEEDTEEAKTFLADSFEGRLSKVEKMTTAITKTQDRAPARAFVRALIVRLKNDASASALRDLLDADRYLRLQGSSAKSILSHLAVSLPRAVRGRPS